MTAPRNPPFRAEHLGSLLRPKKLLETRQAFDGGSASQSQLTSAEDDAVKEIVQTQLDLGFHAVSDGEYRRGMFWGTFFQELDGMTEVNNPPVSIFREYVPDVAGFIEKGGPGNSCICTGKVRHTGKSSLIDQFNHTKSLVPRDQQAGGKLTMISPVWYHLRYREGKAYPQDVYSTEEEYFSDMAKAFRTELDILYEAGVRNIQIDDPLYAYFCSEAMVRGYAEDPTNTRTLSELLDLYIQCYNDCIAQHKDKIHFGLHICRGNFRGSRHFSEGGYDRIATRLFNTLDVHTFYLEYDTPRAGGFEPLAHVPKDKNVVLGVITSKFAELEDRDLVKERVMQAAELMGKGVGESKEQALKRMGISPQCGFASHEEGNAIDHDGMVGKLKLVRSLADEIWGGEP